MLNQQILSLIDRGSRVLDLGCGQGDLLSLLHLEKEVVGYGVEQSYDSICACLSKGIDAFQGDILQSLKLFSDQSFDVVILSQTLQEVEQPLLVLKEVLRVGKQAIVTFPNFGHWKCRLQLLMGNPPKNDLLPFDWYNTPNIRVISISSFYRLCRAEKINVLKQVCADRYFLNRFFSLFFSNLFSEKGFFFISS